MSNPSREEYAKYNKRGNGFTTHVYRQAVSTFFFPSFFAAEPSSQALVFTPKNYRLAFLLGPASGDRDHEKRIMTTIDHLVEGMSRNPDDTTYREDLEQICKWIIRYEAMESLAFSTRI
jgi:hypothetical protein